MFPPVVEPGYFRTNFLDGMGSGQKLTTPMPAYEGTTAHEYIKNLEKYNHNQPGNPVEGAARIWEVVGGEGLAKNKKMLLRLPLGSDTGAALRSKAQQLTDIADHYEEIWKSTDF